MWLLWRRSLSGGQVAINLQAATHYKNDLHSCRVVDAML